jgi:hypothetical protein
MINFNSQIPVVPELINKVKVDEIATLRLTALHINTTPAISNKKEVKIGRPISCRPQDGPDVARGGWLRKKA